MKPASPSYGILGAALIGSIVEWYDLFVYGSLVVTLSVVFFPTNGIVPPILPSLGAFVAGAAVRPLGGALFGRYGDLIGRRFAFILTTVIMGLGSVFVGLLPTYNQVGVFAPIALVLLRILQGLALGGEYGGAAIYIAENTADNNRGFWTSFTQSAATLGLLLASSVALATRIYLGNAAFQSWGWRIPFLGASFLLVIALAIRWKLTETPLFAALKNIKKTSTSPLSDSVARKANLKLILLALMVVSGAAVVWHTAQFYTPIFMQNTLKIDFLTVGIITVVALALGAPFFVFFGWLSDKIGRLKIMLLGSVLGAATFYPIYYTIDLYSHPANIPILTSLLFIQIFLSAMCYGPLGAFLVEYFPGRIRYTSMSISHGIGTGDIGDGTLIIAPLLVILIGNVYAGLIWSTIVPIATSVTAFLLIRETRTTSIWTELNQ
jgi:MFS family permease